MLSFGQNQATREGDAHDDRCSAVSILLGCLLASSPAHCAQSYPDRTVTIVVTSAAGALTDVLTRAVGQRLSQMWNQSIVVENRGGAGHNFAAIAVMARPSPTATRCWPRKPASSPASRTSTPRASCPTIRRPISSRSPAMPAFPRRCWCNPSVPAKSVAEFIALAKAKPGAMTYGTAGVGTALHTAALLLESLTGIKMTAVHYRGAAPALNDLIAGHINMITMGPSVALPAVKAGKLNMLGFGSEKRVAAISRRADHRRDRSGLRGRASSFGLFAPAGTPRE